MLLQALLITLPVLAIASLARTYIHNLRAARKSGLPYINVPYASSPHPPPSPCP